jgi:hypothetical protein
LVLVGVSNGSTPEWSITPTARRRCRFANGRRVMVLNTACHLNTACLPRRMIRTRQLRLTDRPKQAFAGRDMSGMIHAWRRNVRTVSATDAGADRRYRSRPVDWCRSCGNSPEALRLSTMPLSGSGGRWDWAAELLVSEELLTVRHCGHRCAGPFRSRNLEA